MNSNIGRVVALSISKKRGIPKHNVPSVQLIKDWGIEGDIHAGEWHRQISLLAMESIEKMRAQGVDVKPGAFAENITTESINFSRMKVGDRILIGEGILEITQLGKECHSKCAIYKQVGDCVMPKEGVFARVIQQGTASVGEIIKVYCL